MAVAETLSIDDLITKYANKYGVNRNILAQTIQCESQMNPFAVSKTEDYGVVQIHLKSWGITKEQAFDPEFSIDFMAHQFSIDGAHYWVCYQNLFAQ